MLITFYALFMALFMLAATAISIRCEAKKSVNTHTTWGADL